MFLDNSKKSIKKKTISINFSNDIVQSFFFFYKEKKDNFKLKDNFSIIFPGYPYLKNENTLSCWPESKIEFKKSYFSNLAFYNKTFFSKNLTYLLNERLIKKNVNPYFLYNFNEYMQKNFNLIKSVNKKQSVNINENLKLNYTRISYKINSISFFINFYLERYSSKKFLNYILFIIVLVIFISKKMSFFILIFNFIFFLIFTKSLPFLLRNIELFNENIYLKSGIQYNLKQIFFCLFLFCNSVIRSGNLFSN